MTKISRCPCSKSDPASWEGPDKSQSQECCWHKVETTFLWVGEHPHEDQKPGFSTRTMYTYSVFMWFTSSISGFIDFNVSADSSAAVSDGLMRWQNNMETTARTKKWTEPLPPIVMSFKGQTGRKIFGFFLQYFFCYKCFFLWSATTGGTLNSLNSQMVGNKAWKTIFNQFLTFRQKSKVQNSGNDFSYYTRAPSWYSIKLKVETNSSQSDSVKVQVKWK